jgi:hypothetical protein
MAHAKRFGWAIYEAGFVIWLFGYLSTGHASVFDWRAATPWWISNFVPNLEAEVGLGLMFASLIPIYGRAGQKHAEVVKPQGAKASAMPTPRAATIKDTAPNCANTL